MLGDPKLSDQEFLVTQHVEQWHLAHHRSEQVRTLRERRPHEQAAVTATLYGQEQETAHSLCRIPIPLPGSPHPGALFHGPGASRDGIEDLKKWAQNVPRSQSIVLYCGCCPWNRCPNIRPA